MLLGTLGVSLLGNLLTGKGIYRAGKGKGKGVLRAGYGCPSSSASHNKMSSHPLVNLEIQKDYKNEPRFNGTYSRDNLSKIKDGAYIINLDEHSDIGSHWVALYVQNNNSVTNFDSFGGRTYSKRN